MIAPGILTRIEQVNARFSVRVDARDVCSFVKVALRAGPGQIAYLVTATVDARDNVVDVEWQAVERFREPAVFAAFTGPLSHKLSRPGVHRLIGGWGKAAASLGLEDRHQCPGVSECTVLVPFLIRERAGIRLLAEFFYMGHYIRRGLKVNNSLSDLRRKHCRNGVEIAVEKMFGGGHNNQFYHRSPMPCQREEKGVGTDCPLLANATIATSRQLTRRQRKVRTG